jgi:RES domain
MESLATRVAQAPVATVAGTWHRHVVARSANVALDGRTAFGRWGTPDGFPVLYLGQPRSSVVVEAYRHLVDPVEGYQPGMLAPRVYVTCTVNVQDVLDLRTATGRTSVGLPLDVLASETRDRDAYRRCQEVSAVAHQLGLHGLIAPAATDLGSTLVVFPQRIGPAEKIVLVNTEYWEQLPPDPRAPSSRGNLRVVE